MRRLLAASTTKPGSVVSALASDIEFLRSSRDQHGARRRAGLAQGQVEGTDRRRIRPLSARHRERRCRTACHSVANARQSRCSYRHRALRPPALAAPCRRPVPSRPSERRCSPCPVDRCARRRLGRRRWRVVGCGCRELSHRQPIISPPPMAAPALRNERRETSCFACSMMVRIVGPHCPLASFAACLMASRIRT